MTTSTAPMTSAGEAAVFLETSRELGRDYEDAVVAAFVGQLGDRIDDRVAEALDEQLAERTGQPGSLRPAAACRRGDLPVVLVTMLLGAVATVLASGLAAPALAWASLAVIDVAYLSRRN